jgi:transposase
MGARSISRPKKKALACRGRILFEDEASFWLDGTLHQTWSRIGIQPRVDTFGQRKTAHVFGAVSLEDADFTYRFAPVFNGHTFHQFLLQLVSKYSSQKLFIVIDNGACHWLDDDGKRWLKNNRKHIELHRLPPYSPEFNPQEGVWKATRRHATHNRFYSTIAERDAALRKTFSRFQRCPNLISNHVRRFL